MVSIFFSKNTKLNYNATMMGSGNKIMYHRYVYNKMKYVLLMIWEICQDNEFIMIKNM